MLLLVVLVVLEVVTQNTAITENYRISLIESECVSYFFQFKMLFAFFYFTEIYEGGCFTTEKIYFTQVCVSHFSDVYKISH